MRPRCTRWGSSRRPNSRWSSPLPPRNGGEEDGDALAQTDYLTGSVGWLTSVRSLQLIPEIIVSRCSYEGQVDSADFGEDPEIAGRGAPEPETLEEGYWLILLGLTIAAPF